jgi:NAD(P)-dependent dehydrogenase (short-subunit alcohol dehydrogenase family)
LIGKLRSIKGLFRQNRNAVKNTSEVLENADPKKWKEHLFGLTIERWKRLSGRSFWITGAGTGYGRSMACALAAAGAHVFLTGRRIEKLQDSLEEMSSVFGVSTEKCYLIPADLTRYEDILEACEKVKNLCNSLYALVNNAAIPSMPGSRYPLQNDLEEYWERIMATNVKAPWLLTRTIFPHMLKGSQIRVLFITSEAGWADTTGFGMYNVSKAALNSLGVSMAKEYADSFPGVDIQMNIISPGEARTEMNQGSSVSPYSIVSIVLLLLSHPPGGPNGKFFHRDGRHLQFCNTRPYEYSLF